jgi:hypothetical protein
MTSARGAAVLRVGVCVLFVAAGAGCRPQEIPYSAREQDMSGKTIEQVQQEHTAAWMALPGVVGTAIGLHRDKPCILVLTAANTKQIRRKIPATVDGYPVVVQYTGEIRALDEQP